MDTARASRQQSSFLDDRGRPLQLAAQGTIIEEVGGRRPAVMLGVMWLGICLVIGWAVFGFLMHPAAPTLGQLVGSVPFLMIGPLVQWCMKPKGRPILSPLAAMLAAHRRCGACGYDLHQIEPEPDGCVVCPECGGAWHQDRFVLADKDPKDSVVLAKLMATGHMAPREEQCDDRGGPLDQPAKWPPRWLDAGSTPRGAAEALRRLARAKLARFFRYGVPGALAVWGGLGVVFVSRMTDPAPGEIVFVCIVTLLIVGIATYAAARIFIDRATRREAVDALGLCINCGRALPEDAPAFDGCVLCGKCGRAWRRSGTGRACAGVPA